MHDDYNGEERRKYDMRISVVCERLDNFMNVTTEYRKALCGKLDLVVERLNKLPCKEGEATAKGLRVDVNRLIFAAWAIVAVLFVSGAAWGTLKNTVDTNTKKWSVLEPEHQNLIKDVEVLKEKSYGYRGIPLK